MKTKIIFSMVLALLMLACSSQSSSTSVPGPDPVVGVTPHTLTTYASCDDVLVAVHARAKNYIKARLEAYFTCYNVEAVAMEDSGDSSTTSSADFTETNL